jgi:hypothetical protein
MGIRADGAADHAVDKVAAFYRMTSRKGSRMGGRRRIDRPASIELTAERRRRMESGEGRVIRTP